MSATTRIEGFVAEHRPCGQLTGNGSPATAEGYHLFLQCVCGMEFDSWVPMAEATPAIADLAAEN